ncbi:MAG: hypothetical protein GF344_03570 [Chitinivibrionales bacterium]|nr:hypothetical protein [Chitinivibrionales bacterium]MBD3356149.1 hypothetical protein [Chitinivibrionales bacterium]
MLLKMWGLGVVSLILTVANCAAYRNDPCVRAVELRKKADEATGDERALLKAQAEGLEKVCAQEQKKRGEEYRKSEGRKTKILENR